MNSVTKKINLHCEEVLVLSFLRGLGTRVLPASSSTILIASFLQGLVLCTRRILHSRIRLQSSQVIPCHLKRCNSANFYLI